MLLLRLSEKFRGERMERFKSKEYHPYATIKDKFPPLDRLMTTEGFKTIEEAQDQIHLWAENYHLISAEIKVVWDYKWDDTVDTIRVF